MNHERFIEAMRKEVRETVKVAVKETVNGKIDELRRTNDEGMKDINQKIDSHNEKHEKDMAELKPIVTAFHGGKILGEVIKWLASVAIAWVALKTFLQP